METLFSYALNYDIKKENDIDLPFLSKFRTF